MINEMGYEFEVISHLIRVINIMGLGEWKHDMNIERQLLEYIYICIGTRYILGLYHHYHVI